MASMNVLQRINEVRKKNAYIKKDKQVGDGSFGYKAVTHDAVTAALRDDLVEHGVLVVPSVVAGTLKTVQDTGKVQGSKGTPIIRVEAEFDVAYINVDDQKDMVVMRVPAHAEDGGDKAPGKLVSYATKTSLLKMFNIETGEDDEGRNPSERGKKEMSPEDIANWKAKIDELADSKAGEKLWKETIFPKCKEIGDKQATTILHAYMGAKVAQLKKAAKK
jgi:hypothetical protein